MNTDTATQHIQRLLGLNFNDALPFIKPLRSSEARKKRVFEMEVFADQIPSLSDQELEESLDQYR